MERQSLLQTRPNPATDQPLILVVEDNEDSLVLLTQALEPFECQVVGARDGQAGFNLASSYYPDLILLDILLPDMNGQDLAWQLRQLPALVTTPIIAVTALAKAEDRQQILLSGCNDCITKPYILEDLEATIQKHLAIGQPALPFHGS